MSRFANLRSFATGSVRLILRGNRAYWLWIGLLAVLIGGGAIGYWRQFDQGLATTSMRDHVSWAFYIGNFTFLVGVAAAAVLVVIPAYLYQWGPIKEIVVLGELLAIAAVTMCGLFVFVDIGRPDRLLHLVPGIGLLNLPSSLLAWDVIVLNGYLVLNALAAGYVLFSAYVGKKPSKALLLPLVLLSIPWAIGIHTVTAFLYNGLVARPYWNSAILAPRFIASAFCSGPAILLIALQFLRRYSGLKVRDAAIHKLAELMAYAMVINLFLLGAEVFVDVYSNKEHASHIHYAFVGLEGHSSIVPYMWTAVTASVIAVVLFVIPQTRRNPVTLNIGCVLIYIGVYIEKGMGLVIPGFTPDTMGEIYEYFPSRNEIMISMGIFAVGFLVFTLMVKVTIPILLGEFRVDAAMAAAKPPGELLPEASA